MGASSSGLSPKSMGPIFKLLKFYYEYLTTKYTDFSGKRRSMKFDSFSFPQLFYPAAYFFFNVHES
jgi:hypothetical protein